MKVKPSYLEIGIDQLSRRADLLYSKMRNCELCPRRCHVDRLSGETGFCGVADIPFVASYGPHFGEESFLVGTNGSGTIFFSGCNLACVFCQNWEISQAREGRKITIEELATIMLKIQSFGCHNLNLVTPTHQIAMILKALVIAVQKGFTLPVLYNCGGYESSETLRLLDGIVDIYMPDFKYGDNESALLYSGVPDYVEISTSALKEMYQQVGPLTVETGIAVRGVFVRHLVLPKDLTKSQKVFQTIASISKEIPVNVMNQYYPAHRAYEYEELSRRIYPSEFEKAISAARDLGLRIVR
ncbi:radical SAM protein [Pseudothermotoga sp. U03pept]|uniref:radical SAM protein n=1 Tax=Pseudothermotoga sp. U03pept TaxID=3447012 RepID=UPI003F0CFDFD